MNIQNEPETKAHHLAMIAETISRMSTTSAIIKGFSATIIATAATTLYYVSNPLVFALLLFPALAFMLLDLYYLRTERRFRYLYELVRTGERPCDYSMDIKFKPDDCRKAKARLWDCLLSKSILLFYPEIIIVLLIILKMKITGGI